jgi:hypothetical protein
MNNRLSILLNFLDDENTHTAGAAMAELITIGDKLMPYLAQYQEHDNPLVRKRVHQLQAILTLRQRRDGFAAVLNNSGNLIQGLIQVHLQWYDNDSEPHLTSLWEEFQLTANKYPPATMEQVAYLMRKCGFTTAQGSEFQPDYFCFGPVMEDMIGADFMLCAIAKVIAEEHNFKLKIIRRYGNFLLLNSNNQILLPKDHWRLTNCHYNPDKDAWDNTQIIKLASSMLFLAAVSSDSFRYISTIGKSLAALPGNQQLDFLPYPYNEKNASPPENQ